MDYPFAIDVGPPNTKLMMAFRAAFRVPLNSFKMCGQLERVVKFIKSRILEDQHLISVVLVTLVSILISNLSTILRLFEI